MRIVHAPDESAIVCGPPVRPDRVIRVDGAASLVLRQAEAIASEAALLDRLGSIGERSTQELDTTAAPVPLDRVEYQRFLQRSGILVVDQRGWRPSSPEDTLTTLERSGLIVRESNRVLALPVNATRSVRQALAQAKPVEASIPRHEYAGSPS